jgi:glycosyltransferase involved in cell wall biosynthesis
MTLGLALGEPLGGAERFGIELARHLDKERFEPIICAFWRHGAPGEGIWSDYLRANGVEAFFPAEAKGGSYLARYVRGLIRSQDYLRDRRVDIIHSHFQMGSMAALLLKRSLNISICVRTAHNTKEWGAGLGAFVCRQTFTKWLFPIAFEAEVGVSQALVRMLDRRPAARLLGKRALLIPNAISSDRARRSPDEDRRTVRQELGLPPDAITVGTVGRLTRQKGHAIFLEAAANILAARPEARFVIVGDGELRDYLHQKSAALGLGEAVLFTGARTDVERLYGAMDLFVLSSLWEGLPTVILESMSSGVPVVGTDIPGTRELITPDRTGWLAQPNDPASLTGCILDALADPAKRAAYAKAALKEVVPRFSMARVADQYEALYDELIGRTIG